MHLYELPIGSKIKIPTTEFPHGEMFTLAKIDGSFTTCKSDQSVIPGSTALNACQESREPVPAEIMPKAYLEVIQVGEHWELVSSQCPQLPQPPQPTVPKAAVVDRGWRSIMKRLKRLLR